MRSGVCTECLRVRARVPTRWQSTWRVGFLPWLVLPPHLGTVARAASASAAPTAAATAVHAHGIIPGQIRCD